MVTTIQRLTVRGVDHTQAIRGQGSSAMKTQIHSGPSTPTSESGELTSRW